MQSISLRCVVILESPFIARKTTTQPAVEDMYMLTGMLDAVLFIIILLRFSKLDSKFYLNLDIDG